MKKYGRAAVLALSLALAACAAEDCRQGPCSPDEKLAEAVKANIDSHSALLADHLRVSAENGTVYLYGLVSTSLELSEVEEVAKATKGVKKVVNSCAIENQFR